MIHLREAMNRTPLKVETAFSSQSKSSFDSNDSAYLETFAANYSPNNPKFQSLERIINFLGEMPEISFEENSDGAKQKKYNEYLQTLTDLTLQASGAYKDPSFLRILKAFGWTGTRYQMEKKLFDRQKFVQALSNIYLKFQYRNPISMENVLIHEDDDEDGINHLEKIASFCPDIVVHFLENNPSILSTSELTPPTYTFTGACMLADISGFSKFSAAMCSKGVRGLDELRKVTNGLLGQFVKSVYEHEGDVIAFAGDALICVFPDHKRDANELLEEITSLKSVNSTVRALHSASALRSVKFTELSTHIGISYGEMKLVLLGGANGQWNYVVNGACLSQLHECLEEASSQMVVITPECYETLMEVQAHNRNSDDGSFSNSYDEVELDYPTFEFSKVNEHSTNYKLDFVAQTTSFEEILNTNGRKSLISVVSKKKLSANSFNGLVPSRNDSLNTSNNSINQETNNHALLKYVTSNLSDMKPKRISSRSLSVKHLSINEIYSNNSSNYYGDHTSYRQFVESLTVFVPTPVITGLQTESNHQMGELRTVTTMFLCLDSYDPVKNADPSTLQPFFLIAQQALNDSGGFLRQFLIDDKGCVLIGMWGVPSFTYANNCARALFCATTIHKRIKKELDLDCSIGITTGSVFCGTVGAPERCDYVGIGSDVNLAARFMAKANQNIFVDESTFNNLNEKNRKLLIPGQEFNFKGISHPIRPYVYTSEDFPSRQEVDSKIQTKGRLLKKHVMKLLDKQLDRMTNVSPAIISPADFRRSLVRAPKRRSLKVNVSTVLNNVQFTVLVGQPGTGKSTAAHYFRIGARERGVQTVHLIAQSKHRNSPYSIIREFFLELVGVDNFKFPAQQANLLRNLISDAYPEYDYTDADRRHVKMVVEMVLGVTSLLQEFTSPTAAPPKRVTSLASSSRSPVLQRQQSAEQRMQELNLEIDEEFRFSAFQELIVSPSRLHSIRFQQLMQHRESRSSTLKTGHFSLSHSESNDQNIEMNLPDPNLPSFSTKLTTENENQIFFKIIAVYLRNIPIAVIIENAHFCDELSWNALFLLLTGTNLDASVLLTVRSNPLQRLRSSAKNFHTALSSPKLIFQNGFGMKGAHSTSSPDLKQQYQNGTLNPSTSKYSFNSINSSQDIDQKMINYALDHITVESFRSILAHTNCTIYEMRNLNEDEVKSFLVHKLKVTSISEELVKTVFNASSGNAYWCNMICDFIEEYGLHRLEMTTKSAHKPKMPGSADSRDDALSGMSLDVASESSAEDTEEVTSNPVTVSSDQTTNLSSKKVENPKKRKKTLRQPSLSSIHTLRTLILYRFELLSSEYQTILKYASIIGSEFTPPLLHSILPAKLQDGSVSMEDIPIRKSQFGMIKGTSDHFSADDIHNQMKTSFSNGNSSNHRRLRESLEHLERHGFLSCISEHPTYIYTFQNELIQRTVYELILPSDAALIHFQIANYLEEAFEENLRPFYPSLAFHFKLGLDHQNAFKYEIKAAALAISSGAFNDGYKLAEASLDVFSNIVELDIVIQICTHAIEELQVILNSLGAKTPPISEAPSMSIYQNTIQNTSQIIRNLSKSFFGFITGNGTANQSSTASNGASVKASSANMPKAFYPFKGQSARTNSNLSEISAAAAVDEQIDRVTKDHSFANDAPPSTYPSPVKKSVKINLDFDHSAHANENFLKLQIQPESKANDSSYSLPNSGTNTPKSALKSLSINYYNSSFNDSIFDLTPTQKTEVSIRQSQYTAFLTLKHKVELMKAQIMKSPTKHPLPVKFYGGSSVNSPGLSSQGSTPGKYLNYLSTRDPTPNSPNTYGVNSDENSEMDLSQARNALNASSNKFKITWKPSFVDQATISPASRYFSNDLDELRFTFDADDFKRPPPINIIPPSLQASSPEDMKTTPLPFARFYHLRQTSNESTKGGLKVSPPSVSSISKLEKQSSDEYFEYYRLSSDDSISRRNSTNNKPSPQYYDVGCQCIIS